MADSEHSNASSGGIGFFGLLQIVFIAGKVFGFLDWSWWLVFTPFFIYMGILIIAILITALIAFFC